jgi:hypothetical protein
MTESERQSFLADLHVGIVSVPRPRKGPLTIPIWYDYEPGGEPWLITDKTSLKGRLLETADAISLCVQSEQAPYRYVSVEGPFTVSPTPTDALLHMAVRYLGEDAGRAYAQASTSGESSIVVRIRPRTWYTVDYAKR